MDIDNAYILRAFIANTAFLVSLGVVMTLVVSWLVRAEERRVSRAVVWSMLLIISFVWLWGVAYMHFPAADELIRRFMGGISSEVVAATPTTQERQRDEVSSEDTTSSESASSVTGEETSVVEGDDRMWGEGTPRGPRGHLTNR